MKKRLGIDIDGTVTCPKTIIPYMNRDFKLNIRYEDVKNYDLSTLVTVPRRDFAKWWYAKEAEVYQASPLAPGAKEALEQLEKYFELIFISARGKEHLTLTEKWFQDYGLKFHHIELVGSHNKVEAAKHWKVEAFFEDKHDNAIQIHEECNIPVILFDTPYNQDPIPEGVFRVLTWEEALIITKEIFSEKKAQ